MLLSFEELRKIFNLNMKHTIVSKYLINQLASAIKI